MDLSTKWSINSKNINPKQNSDSPPPPRRATAMVGRMTAPIEVITPSSDANFFLQAPSMMPVSTSLGGVVREGLTSRTANLGKQIKTSVELQTTTSATPTTIDMSSATPSAFGDAFGKASATVNTGAAAFASGLLKAGTDIKNLSMLATGTASPAAYKELGNVIAKGKMSAQVGGTGVVLTVKKTGEISVSDLDKLTFGVFDWINYAVDSSYNGQDANGNPTYVIVPDFADKELDRDLEMNGKGLTDFKLGGQGCALGAKFDVNARLAKMNNLTDAENAQRKKMNDPEQAAQSASSSGAEKNTPTATALPENTNEEGATNSQVTIKYEGETPQEEKNPQSSAEAAEQGVANIMKNIRSNYLYRLIRDNLKYIEFPFIYYRWIVKKIGIGFCRLIAKTQRLENPPTEEEERLVISKMGSVFSLLISILITYNWFFLMFYEYSDKYGTERPRTWNLGYQRFQDSIPFLHFMMEYVFYPVDCLNWLLLDKIPSWVKWFFPNPNGTLLFFIMYVVTFQMVETYGGCTVDLFYDSFKIFLNHSLKPWDLLHKYSDGSEYSITAKTYWFLHFMIFSSQVPTFIPSFYEGFKNAVKTGWNKASGMKEAHDSREEAKDEEGEDENEQTSEIVKNIMDQIISNKMDTEQFIALDHAQKKKFEKDILNRWMKFNKQYIVEYWNVIRDIEDPKKFDDDKFKKVNEYFKKLFNELKELMERFIIPNIKKRADNHIKVINHNIQINARMTN